MPNQLFLPDDLKTLVLKRFQNNHRLWIAEPSKVNLIFNLGAPTEQQAIQNFELITQWIQIWTQWKGQGSVTWQTRRWRQIGNQRVPTSISFTNIEDLTRFIGREALWSLTAHRYTAWLQNWPDIPVTGELFQVFAQYSQEDFVLLERLILWLKENPQSGLYLRQVPVNGMDTKWLEKRIGLVCNLVSPINSRAQAGDLNDVNLLGLKGSPVVARLRLLDQEIRNLVGGLKDIQAPCAELATLGIQPKTVFIVENLQTFLAFQDLPSSVVLFGEGYNVKQMCRIGWVQEAQCFYWGDLDTHGFVILGMARSVLPEMKSFMMDLETLENCREFWVSEPHPRITTIPFLTTDEQMTYSFINTQMVGSTVRLEQERIPWEYAWNVISVLADSTIF